LPSAIKAARKRKRLTQAEAAEAVGVTIRAWRYWETGGRAMPLAAWTLFKRLRINKADPTASRTE
jgi:DNA-binding transcriptional regulator YiaG